VVKDLISYLLTPHLPPAKKWPGVGNSLLFEIFYPSCSILTSNFAHLKSAPRDHLPHQLHLLYTTTVDPTTHAHLCLTLTGFTNGYQQILLGFIHLKHLSSTDTPVPCKSVSLPHA
jgi:hypothetical protein